LNRIKNRNRHEMIAFQPRSTCLRERVSCCRTVSKVRRRDQFDWEGLIQELGTRGQRARALRSQSVSAGRGRLEKAIRGSKEVKMSVNIRS